jgi:hypothetical protein
VPEARHGTETNRAGSGWSDLAIAAGFALESDAPRAWPHMAKAARNGGGDPEILVRLGGVALTLKKDLSAAGYFKRALVLEPKMAGAEEGLAMAAAIAVSRGDA